ncbi:dipeptide/oligopeptide/nickel ABC transporter permease/ATP-binding protein [Actinosynnema sp. NPDC047251]|uniref:ABC-type transporter, permease/ATPase subunit n=1 Tax=Saccharothrix espanaensis (strain ATCC 51144 / DSM 44229 / JCM 9112 / NBRC 15066 / NRRL 15764) TaxID=1179773 RepID=K0JXS7_SACES|nr:dipeptide/oligopeptide/nickel ABC transporter permease/ATP-binding protein [Saccharothrix espanaensis]CCH30097.1 ABC-type transporter, permease/ATPase subunit [Saccharothrix espanaensis DSM 44229]
MSTLPGAAVRRSRPVLRHLASPTAVIGVVGTLIFVGLAVLAPVLWGDAAAQEDLAAIGRGASAEHWLGTDASGRDILLRTLVATRTSLFYGLLATVIGVVLGVVVGCLPYVLPVWLGRLVVSTVNMLVAFPALLLVLFLAVFFGQGTVGAVFALGLAIAPTVARLCQTMAASVAGMEYISAARVLGVSRSKVLFRHVIPNIGDVVLVNATAAAANSLTAFAGLSFLGLGVQAPDYDWGRLLAEGLSRMYLQPAAALGPAAAVVLAGIALTMLGDAVGRAVGITPVLSLRRLGSRPTRTAPAAEPDRSAVLSVRDLWVRFPTEDGWRSPVRGVSFDVAAGERVGIVGESGSGKSLTALSVAQLVDGPGVVDAGSIRFDGFEYAGLTRKQVKARGDHLGTALSMVFQDPMSSLNPSLRVGAQVAEVALLHGGTGAARARERAVARLAEVGIPDPAARAEQYPFQFSGGMRQRAMIAMGLMGRPRLIIADEPTTALDTTVQREVLRLLDRVAAEHAAAVVFISHDIALVTGFCDRVLVMYQGEVVEDITTADLVAGRAAHPYSRALMASIPTLTTDKSAPLPTVGDFVKGAGE